MMMKIAVSASGPDLESRVDPRFGRAPYFLIVNPDTMEFEVVENRINLQAAHGAGIQAATLVARHRPAAVITGHCGPKAYDTLVAAGIQVIVGLEGPIRQVVQQYQKGNLQAASAPDVTEHW
jgi:predicted Fe-Mo cluster-binding NifX family protein